VGHWPIFCFSPRRTELTATQAEVLALLEPAVAALGYELVDLELRVGRGHGLVRLFIDAENGITLDDCEKVSREVSALLDVEDPIPGDYNLEVSSPGLDRKLVRPVDYDRFAGCRVKVRLLDKLNGRRRLSGVLLRREDDMVLLDIDGKDFAVPISAIETARLVPDLGGGTRAS